MELQDNTIFWELIKATRTLKRIIDEQCKNYGLNTIQLGIIVLSCCEKMTVSSLSEVIGVSKSAISQALFKLQLKKYVTKKQMEGNKKVFYIIPLSRGQIVKQELLDILRQKEKKVNDQMGLDNTMNLKELITKYNYVLKQINQ